MRKVTENLLLKGQQICLTEIRLEDSDTMFRWINDADTVRFSAPFAPVTRESHDAWFANIGRDPSRAVLAIRKPEDQKIIGVVQLINIHPIHRSAELTTRIGADEHRGKGYGSEALKLAIDFAWTDLNLQRVWLRVFSTNERAMEAYKNAGFEVEGTMRRSAWIDGKWTDEVVMAVLRDINPELK